jgi:hypothetical protein
LIAAVVAIAGWAASASAQAAADRTVLGVGVSILYDNEDASANGGVVDVVYHFPANGPIAVGAVGDFALHRYSDGLVSLNVTSYLGGVRFTSFASGRVRPFGQFLAGFERCCGSADLALQPGGGIDLVVTDALNLRAQVDFRRVRFEGESFNETRFTFGISLPVFR